MLFFFFKQKTAYEMRISDWSSDVCSSDLTPAPAAGTAPAALAPTGEAEFSEELSQRTFRYFWDTTDTERCLAPARWPSNPFSSIAATGFALTAYGIGAERGYVTRAEAAARTRDCLRFYWNAPQGPEAAGGALRLSAGRAPPLRGWRGAALCGPAMESAPRVSM